MKSASSRPRKKVREKYLAIPYSIMNLRDIKFCQKALLAHIYGFGQRGCWQSNQTLAEFFMVSPRAISRWICAVRKYIYIRNPKGYYRTLFAGSHPDVQLMLASRRKSGANCPAAGLAKGGEPVGRNRLTDRAKNGSRPCRNCLTTNINTNKETIKKPKEPPPPLPAGGQASAVLAERKRQGLAEIEKFKKTFGGHGWKPMTKVEFEKRRQEMRRALFAGSRRPKPVDTLSG